MKKKIRATYENDTVLDILRREKVYLCADCGGTGSCGKCRIRAFSVEDVDAGSRSDEGNSSGLKRMGTPELTLSALTDVEQKILSEEDLAKGIRLACQTKISTVEDTVIEIPSSSLIQEEGVTEINAKKIEPLSTSEVIAVDFGTTVISGSLVDLNAGIKDEASVINHQKAYGADVISRIKASNDGLGEELRHIALDDLAELAEKLGRDPEKARYIISGNTVMEHILSGFSLRGLGTFPYKPVDISLRREDDFVFLPGISAFVGADIVSGICACSLDKASKPWLYVDLGTNGEMAIGTGKEILVASAPAGPAFEGGRLSCGMPAVSGAVESVSIIGRRAVTTTIGGGKAKGICGSGVIDTLAAMIRNGIIDANGTIEREFAEEGFEIDGDVVITQKDIRELQKAKAAIRAGMEILIEESGVKPEEIEKLVLAGSFGENIDMENASAVGLIPEKLISVCGTCGNASLTGATLYALDTGFGSRLSDVASRAIEISLSETREFERRYVSYMAFSLSKKLNSACNS